jgi:ketosteroid isomerase-like protein
VTARSNLEALKAAYQAWHDTKGGRTDMWLDLFADRVCIHSTGGDSRGLQFAKPRHSRDEAVDYFTALLDDWTMIHFTPEAFVVEGDSVAMFGHCAWTCKATGKPVEVAIAHLWRFVDDKVAELLEIFDTGKAIAAATTEPGA